MKFAKKNINIYLGVAEYLYLYSSLGGENTVVVSKLTSSEIDIWWQFITKTGLKANGFSDNDQSKNLPALMAESGVELDFYLNRSLKN